MIQKSEKYKGQFKNIDTEEKAYFLGFAFGDGCNTYSKGYKFTMASIKEDKEIFIKFGKIFPFFKVCKYPSKPKVIFLECYEKDFVIDLIKLGLLQNKKLQDLQNNFKIPDIEDRFLNHFIRGFFDADGCVYIPSRYRSRNNIKIEIGLGTENFCLQIKQLLEDNNIKLQYIVRSKKANNNKYYNSYTLMSSCRGKSLKFAEFIYKNSTIFLKRKYEKFYKYEKSKLQLRREKYPNCLYCKHNKVVSKGIRNNKLRLNCKKCNKNFSVNLPII